MQNKLREEDRIWYEILEMTKDEYPIDYQPCVGVTIARSTAEKLLSEAAIKQARKENFSTLFWEGLIGRELAEYDLIKGWLLPLLVPLTLALPAFFGVTGALYSAQVADTLSIIAVIFVMLHIFRHLNSLPAEQAADGQAQTGLALDSPL